MAKNRRLQSKPPPSIVLVASPSVALCKRWSKNLPPNSLVHEVGDGIALKIGMEKLHPSVVLLDSRLLRPSRSRTLTKLQQLSTGTKIIIFSDNPNETEGIATLKAGAKGYCSKSLKAPLLKRAVDKVGSGEVWIGRRLMACLIDEFYRLSGPAARYEYSDLQKNSSCSLTPRECDVARLISSGARNKEISSVLGVSEKTVKAHLTAIFTKLGVSDRLSLAVYLREQSPPSDQPAPSDSPEISKSPS